MKTTPHLPLALLAGTALILTVSFADARCYGLCRPAYHRAVAVVGVNDGTDVDSDEAPPPGESAPPPGVSPATAPDEGDVPMNGYVSTIPADYQVVQYQGYTCYLANGVYYRPIFYEGKTVYIVVTSAGF